MPALGHIFVDQLSSLGKVMSDPAPSVSSSAGDVPFFLPVCSSAD